MYDDLYFSPYFYHGGTPVGGSWAWRRPDTGDWTCEYCGSLHPGSAYTCDRCGAPRRAERPKPAPLVSSAQAAVWSVVPRKPTFRERLRIRYTYWWDWFVPRFMRVFHQLVLLGLWVAIAMLCLLLLYLTGLWNLLARL